MIDLSKTVPLCKAAIGDEELEAAMNVIKSGWLTHGPKTSEFETIFADFLGVRHAVAMNSCTSALFVSLIINDIRGEVILPSFTFVASANAVTTAGATPIFADVDRKTCNITAELIEPLITPQTEAVMVVHYGGQCCKMDEIAALCDKNGLLLIEDSAETIGGTFDGSHAGSWGIAGWSFFPTKNITTGEGGMLTTNDDTAAQKARALIGHGIVKHSFERQGSSEPWKRVAVVPGYNFRMSNILAAIGVEQMKKLDRFNDQRRANSATLISLLQNIEGLELPIPEEQCYHVYQMFTVKIPGRDRDACVRYLRSCGIEASVHFDPPVHKHPYYAGVQSGDLSNTEELSAEILTLPMFPDMSERQIVQVSEVLKTWLSQN